MCKVRDQYESDEAYQAIVSSNSIIGPSEGFREDLVQVNPVKISEFNKF